MATSEPGDPDIDAFFRGEADSFLEFAPIRPVPHRQPGHLLRGSHELGNEGRRLIKFAHQFGSYDWNNDPHHNETVGLLERYNVGEYSARVDRSFDVLWRCLFAAVRQDRSSQGTIAHSATALVRIANELRRRLLQERAGGESEPPDVTVDEYVSDRVRRRPPEGCSVVVGSTPVVAFGDPSTARAATLGLNPSRAEFARAGHLLAKGERRLQSMRSLGVESLENADPETVGRVVGACRRYFWRRPYRRWFDQLESILITLGFSYYNGSACHLDLVQSATDPTWAKLGANQRRRLLDRDVPFVRDQLERSSLAVLLINGSGVRTWAAATLRIEFAEVAGVAQDGVVTGFAVGKFRGRLPVLAWSTNLQSSWGVTRALRRAIASRASQLVSEGW